jgi:hypothetical protein
MVSGCCWRTKNCFFRSLTSPGFSMPLSGRFFMSSVHQQTICIGLSWMWTWRLSLFVIPRDSHWSVNPMPELGWIVRSQDPSNCSTNPSWSTGVPPANKFSGVTPETIASECRAREISARCRMVFRSDRTALPFGFAVGEGSRKRRKPFRDSDPSYFSLTRQRIGVHRAAPQRHAKRLTLGRPSVQSP